MLILNHNGEYIKPKKVFDKFYAITCGEEGWGRKLGFIPLAKVYQTKENIITDIFTEEIEVIKTQKGNWLIIPSEKKEGLILVTEWYGGFRGGITSNIQELVEQNKIEILAEGRTAEGHAGRMGGEEQYILKILKSCKIYYTKHGRTYDGNSKDWVIDIDLENRKVEHYPLLVDIELDY